MKLFTKLLISTAISSSALLGIAPSSSMAEEAGYYFSVGVGTGIETEIEGDVGGSSFSGDVRTTIIGGVGIGYDFGNNWRVEASVSRSTADADSVTVDGVEYDVDESSSGTGIGLGLAYDFVNDSRWTPYVSASIGRSWADDADDSVTSYGVGAGVATPVSDTVDLVGSVGYGFTPDQTIDDVDYDEAGAWSVGLGLRVRL